MSEEGRTIENIQKDIELLGIKGGYDIEQILTPQDCRRLSYEIYKYENKIQKIENYLDRQHDVPIEILVNIKNIIYGEVEDEVI